MQIKDIFTTVNLYQLFIFKLNHRSYLLEQRNTQTVKWRNIFLKKLFAINKIFS